MSETAYPQMSFFLFTCLYTHGFVNPLNKPFPFPRLTPRSQRRDPGCSARAAGSAHPGWKGSGEDLGVFGGDDWYPLGAGGSRFIAPFVSTDLWEGGMGETGGRRGSVSPSGSRGAGRRGWVCLQGQQSRSRCR